MSRCLFCDHEALQTICSSETMLAIRDEYPVAPGHALVLPRRHVASFFELSDTELTDMLRLARRVMTILAAEYEPDGWNMGLNDGVSAGQTVMHLHLHLIPRSHGDVPDPRGGVRWVIPASARYWEDES